MREEESLGDFDALPVDGACDPDGMALRAETDPGFPDLCASLEELVELAEPVEVAMESGSSGSRHDFAANPFADGSVGKEIASVSHGIGCDLRDLDLSQPGTSPTRTGPSAPIGDRIGRAAPRMGKPPIDPAYGANDSGSPPGGTPLSASSAGLDAETESGVGLFWDETENFLDDFLPLEDLPLESEPGTADGGRESFVEEDAPVLEETPVLEDAHGEDRGAAWLEEQALSEEGPEPEERAERDREAIQAEREAPQVESSAQVEAVDRGGTAATVDEFEDEFQDEFADARDEPAPFVLEEAEAFAGLETNEEDFDPISALLELHPPSLPEATEAVESTVEFADESELPIESREEVSSAEGMVEEGVPTAEITETAGPKIPEPAMLAVSCPACKQALRLRREYLGVGGACVWCQTPIVAAACGLTGEVKVFRIAMESPEPEVDPPAALAQSGEGAANAGAPLACPSASSEPPVRESEPTGEELPVFDETEPVTAAPIETARIAPVETTGPEEANSSGSADPETDAAPAEAKEEPAKPEFPRMNPEPNPPREELDSPPMEEKARLPSRERIWEEPPSRSRLAPPPRERPEPGRKLRKSPLDAIRATGATSALRAETESAISPPSSETGSSRAVTESMAPEPQSTTSLVADLPRQTAPEIDPAPAPVGSEAVLDEAGEDILMDASAPVSEEKTEIDPGTLLPPGSEAGIANEPLPPPRIAAGLSPDPELAEDFGIPPSAILPPDVSPGSEQKPAPSFAGKSESLPDRPDPFAIGDPFAEFLDPEPKADEAAHGEFPPPDDFDNFFSPPDFEPNPFRDPGGSADLGWETSGIPPMRKVGDSLPTPRISGDTLPTAPEDWHETPDRRMAASFALPGQAHGNPFTDSGPFSGGREEPLGAEDSIFSSQPANSDSLDLGRVDPGFGNLIPSAFPPGPGFFPDPAGKPARKSSSGERGSGKIAGLLLGVFGLVFGVGAASFFWSDIIESFQNAVTEKIEMTAGTEWPDSRDPENFSKNHTESTVAEGAHQPEPDQTAPALPVQPQTP